jgi:hypothetical protein
VTSYPNTSAIKHLQWQAAKENHRAESPPEARSASMEARSSKATLARPVFRLVLCEHNFYVCGRLHRCSLGVLRFRSIVDAVLLSPHSVASRTINNKLDARGSVFSQLFDLPFSKTSPNLHDYALQVIVTRLECQQIQDLHARLDFFRRPRPLPQFS